MTWLVGEGDVVWHTAVKAVLLVIVAVVGFRFGERRTFAQLAPFDFVAVISVEPSWAAPRRPRTARSSTGRWR